MKLFSENTAVCSKQGESQVVLGSQNNTSERQRVREPLGELLGATQALSTHSLTRVLANPLEPVLREMRVLLTGSRVALPGKP